MIAYRAAPLQIMNDHPFAGDIPASHQALLNVAKCMRRNTVVTRRHNGKGRSSTYAGNPDALAQNGRQLADMVVDFLLPTKLVWNIKSDRMKAYAKTSAGNFSVVFSGHDDYIWECITPWGRNLCNDLSDGIAKCNDELQRIRADYFAIDPL